MIERDDIDAERFAESLDALDEGRDPGIDALEDPGLALDLEAAQALRTAAAAVEPRATYRERSRALLLQSMREASGGKPAASPFYRRWGLVFAPVAAAAAAAAISVAVLGGSNAAPTTAPQPEQLAAVATEPAAPAVIPPLAADTSDALDAMEEELAAAVPAAAGPNLTSRSVVDELDRIMVALEAINERAGGGELVEAQLLQIITAGTASLAALIESDPDTLTDQAVITYIQAAATGRTVLSQATVAPENEATLVAAQRAAQNGVEVASNYFALRTN